MKPNEQEFEVVKKGYVILANLIVLIIPFIAMLDYGFSGSILGIIEEYVIVLIGFFWTPFMLFMAILDWDFEARYSPLLKLIFWTVPPLIFAYSVHSKSDDYKESIIAGYTTMLIGMVMSLMVLFILMLINTVISGDDPFASLAV